jgi:hypothetical protein
MSGSPSGSVKRAVLNMATLHGRASGIIAITKPDGEPNSVSDHYINLLIVYQNAGMIS